MCVYVCVIFMNRGVSTFCHQAALLFTVPVSKHIRLCQTVTETWTESSLSVEVRPSLTKASGAVCLAVENLGKQTQ